MDKNNISEDYTLIFVGDKNGGKTTFINKIHERGNILKNFHNLQ